MLNKVISLLSKCTEGYDACSLHYSDRSEDNGKRKRKGFKYFMLQ